MGAATTLRVEQLTGPKTVIELRGRALPYQGMPFGVRQRNTITWLPGNTEATAQVYGGQDQETTISGEWKDRFIKPFNDEGEMVFPQGEATVGSNSDAGSQVEDVFALISAFDRICRQGQLVKVTWDAFVRVGLLVEFTPKMTRREDVQWEMKFAWTSRGEALQPPVLPQREVTATTLGTLRALYRKMLDAIYGVDGLMDKVGMVESYITQVGARVVQIEALLTEATVIAESGFDGLVAKSDTLSRLVGTTKALAQTSRAFADFLSGQSPYRYAAPKDETSPSGGGLSAAASLNAVAFNRKAAQDANAIAVSANTHAREMLRQAAPDLLDVYVAKQGDDLRDVSTLYYGTPDEWRYLLTYNGFDSSWLDIGQRVLVPRLGGV